MTVKRKETETGTRKGAGGVGGRGGREILRSCHQITGLKAKFIPANVRTDIQKYTHVSPETVMDI